LLGLCTHIATHTRHWEGQGCRPSANSCRSVDYQKQLKSS